MRLRSVRGVRRSRVRCIRVVVLFFLFLQSQKLDQFRIPIWVMLMLGVLVLFMIFLHMLFVLLLIQLVLVFRRIVSHAHYTDMALSLAV